MREPDFIIGDPDRPYLLRWYLIPRNRVLNVYLHSIIRDDDDRALHCHPWWNLSIVLKGAYREIMPDLKNVPTPHLRVWDMPRIERIRMRGSFVLRRPTAAHRLEVVDSPVWTLFITGPRIREWGFHCKFGWRHWREFVSPHNTGEVGRGCE